MSTGNDELGDGEVGDMGDMGEAGDMDEMGDDGIGDDGIGDLPTDEGECPAPRDTVPTIALPATHENEYLLELGTWAIANDGSDPIGTRAKLNEALSWAFDEGYDAVRIPPGLYLVGEQTTGNYTAGVEIPGSMTLTLDPDAELRMAPNATWNYCVVAIRGLEDVTVRGGVIRGDRDEHTYDGAHDEGHGICVEGGSQRVLIEDTELTELTGDGVLIVGQSQAGSCLDVTIRDSELHHNRRQGVSIVGGIRVLVENNHIHHISGTAPQFGIDIESLSFTSEDIVIRGNDFNDNKGGDYVNTDGHRVWFEDNVLDQGALTDQIDGPIVIWKETDQTIRGNSITMSSSTVNGRWGVIGYASDSDPRVNEQPNFIEDNSFHGCGLHLARSIDRAEVHGNSFDEWMILGSRISCLRLTDNHVSKAEGESYKFREVSGQASDNTLNGHPVFLPMSDNAPFTNSPPHLW